MGNASNQPLRGLRVHKMLCSSGETEIPSNPRKKRTAECRFYCWGTAYSFDNPSDRSVSPSRKCKSEQGAVSMFGKGSHSTAPSLKTSTLSPVVGDRFNKRQYIALIDTFVIASLPGQYPNLIL